MAEPLARFEGFEGFQGFEGFEGFQGFEGFEGFEAFEGQFRATRKKGFGAPELQRPVWQNHWQGSRGLRGFRGLRGLRRLKGSFAPLEKKDLARQSSNGQYGRTIGKVRGV